MKRLQTYLLLALSLIFLVTLPNRAESRAESWSYPSSDPGLSSFEGKGKASSPYLIQSAQDLANLAYIVTDANNDVSGKYFKMTRDIYLNDFTVDAEGNITANGDLKEWTPIGEYKFIMDDDFQGYFDGDGHTIYGLYINEEKPRFYVGLFGSTDCATIKNLSLKNVYIRTGSSDHKCAVGALVGCGWGSTYTNIRVEGCYIENNGSFSYTMYVGGFIGVAQGIVSLNNCFFDGNIKLFYNYHTIAGGLVGSFWKSASNFYVELFLTRCQTKGEIKLISDCTQQAAGGVYIGGFLGDEYYKRTNDKYVYITECVNRLNIKYENDNSTYPPGFYTYNYAYLIDKIQRSANLGTVTIATRKVKNVGIWHNYAGPKKGTSYIDCVNYGHYILPENHDSINISINPGQNKVHHDANGQNLIIWKEAKPTNLSDKDTYDSNGTELSLDSLNNNRELVAQLNEEAGENVWGLYYITENGQTYSVPFPIACGGVPISMYKNDKGQYLISSEADLRILQNLVKNNAFIDDYFILTRDLDMSTSEPLEQIGDETHPFKGTLDGNGHVISGMTINGHALFGNLSGTVKNLALMNMKFTGNYAHCAPFAYQAGRSADASILNCYVGGTITLADNASAGTILAGLIYEAISDKVSIKNSYFKGVMANATNLSNQGHFYYGMVGSNKIGTSLSINNSYADFDFNDTWGIGAGILPTGEASAPSGTNYHYICPQFSDSIGKVNSNAELAACFKNKEGWLPGAYRPVLDSARHYKLTTYDNQTVYADANPMDDDSCRNEIFCHQITGAPSIDPFLWALPKVAVCDTENNVNYLINCQLYADKPFRFTPPEGTETKGQLHYPLTFPDKDEYAIRLMCLPGTLHKSDLPEGTQLFLMGKPTGGTGEGYSAYCVACDSIPAGVPFLIYMSKKPTDTLDVVLSGNVVGKPQTTGTLNGQELESGLFGTFEDKHIDNGCANIDILDINVDIKNEDNIDIKPFSAYLDADATVTCDAGVLLKETSNYIDQTLATYKDQTVTVFLSRKLQTSGWNTLCLPFNLTQAEVRNHYGDLTRLEELTSITTEADGTCTLNFTSATGIEAGKCYLILPAVAYGRMYQFDDKTLSTDLHPTTLTSSDGSYTLSFIGSFARTTIDGNDTSKGTYFTQNNKIYKVAEGRTIVMNGFRCWIETSKPNILTKANIIHSDGSTSIARIVPIGTTEDNHRIYDLQGIETTNPQPNHIYIKKGRRPFVFASPTH